MASSEQPELSSLKYLGFFEIVANKATKYVANIYGFAKESSGPLKPSVEGVETTVRMVVGPVYEKIEGKPHEVLLFVERKVDDAVAVLDGALFQTLKKRSSQACGVAQEVPEIVKSVVNELQTNDIVGIAKSYYVAYEPVAEEWTCAAWKQLLKLPCAPQAVHFLAPPTLFCAEKFNHVVQNLKEMHVPLAGYIPTFPLEKLERVLHVHVA